VSVTHLAFDFGPWGECGHGVDDNNVDGSGTDQHVGDFESLLASVWLRDEQFVDVDTDVLGVLGIHGVLSVDVCADAAVALGFGHYVHGERRLT
jgi:hypothetical protein